MFQDDLGSFGDARLRRVGAELLDAMCQKPTTCIHALADDSDQEPTFGRFLDHSSVSCDEMLTTTGRFTRRRAAECHVLAILQARRGRPDNGVKDVFLLCIAA
jgi:hypothetical protein